MEGASAGGGPAQKKQRVRGKDEAGAAESSSGVDHQAALKAVVANLDLLLGDDELEPPPKVMKMALMPHQRMALAWMCKRELSGSNPSGGILADDQGLGKTVSTISLLVTNPPDPTATGPRAAAPAASPTLSPSGKPLCVDGSSSGAAASEQLPMLELPPCLEAEGAEEEGEGAESEEEEEQEQEEEELPGLLPGGSLVVCPTSLLHQWRREVEAKVNCRAAGITVHVYHGKDKASLASTLSKYSVVLTTFGTLASECPARPTPPSRASANRPQPRAKAAGSPNAPPSAQPARQPKLESGQAGVLKQEGEAGVALKLEGSGRAVKEEGQDLKPGPGNSSSQVGGVAAAGAKGSQTPGPHRSGQGTSPLPSALNSTPGRPSAHLAAGLESVGPLYRIRWHRVVLDEAQSIKNSRTLAAHAVCRLAARYRWCLSGTPIQNSVDDLQAYFQFLRFRPYNDPRHFRLFIKAPITADPEAGYKRLAVILQQYVNMLYSLLRLRQGCNHPWLVKGGPGGVKAGGGGAEGRPATAAELAAARKLSPGQREQLLAAVRQGGAQCGVCGDVAEDAVVGRCGHSYCRQCAAGQLEGAGPDDDFLCTTCSAVLRTPDVFGAAALQAASGAQGGAAAKAAKAAAAAKRTGKQAGRRASSRACVACLTCVTLPLFRVVCGVVSAAEGDSKAAAWVSSAKVDCLLALLEEVRQRNAGQEVKPAGRAAAAPTNVLLGKQSKTSAQLKGVFKRLPSAPAAKEGGQGGGMSQGGRLLRDGRKPEKVIVFSQWTGMLDVLEIALRRAGHVFTRLDGGLSIAAREQAIAEFEGKAEVLVLLVSLKAAALGLNLTVANHVVLMDLWWNPTIEEQAIDRAHRIGQTRVVQVTRITIKGSVEERILQLQDQKRQVVAAALSEGAQGGQALNRLSMEDLRFLFLGAPASTPATAPSQLVNTAPGTPPGTIQPAPAPGAAESDPERVPVAALPVDPSNSPAPVVAAGQNAVSGADDELPPPPATVPAAQPTPPGHEGSALAAPDVVVHPSQEPGIGSQAAEDATGGLGLGQQKGTQEQT
ncbi:hypothetical protein QJQ45_026984 [Haematococcus lacustris]|nr:hypothetical protein QJQ45_026984 [Haematococcus lacustris]